MGPHWNLELGHSTLPYGENPEFLSYPDLIRYRGVTPGWADRQTDRIAVASTR